MSVVTYAVLRVDEDGGSYFEDRQVELEPAEFVPGIPLVDLGASVPVSSLMLCRCDANDVSDWTRTVGTDPCVFLAVAIGDGA